MEAPRQTFDRLVEALDELVTREAATLAEHDYQTVNEIQRRADPVVEALASLGGLVSDAVARARVAGLLARRQHSIDFLETQLATARAELMAVQASTLRVAQIAPVYGRTLALAHPPQFRAAG
jgi:hypothetical protein